MANDESQTLSPRPARSLPRPKYEGGAYLTTHDLLTEQQYRLQRLRRHNRYLHGWGVICGLRTASAQEAGRPWAVLICPGNAITCCGDIIEVCAPVLVDISDCLWARPMVGRRPLPVAYIGIRYDEEYQRMAPINASSCGCDDPIYQPSRIQDSFRVDVLWELPEAPHADRFDLCEQSSAPCPECPDHHYVILARVNLPLSEHDPITNDHIQNM